MNPSLFVIDKTNALQELSRQDYDSEDLFQTLLAEHPGLLGHASGGRASLLLVRREAGVPAEQAGSARWSLDHLFIDQDAVPIMVEVKRSSDTRLRREVVGQMLDYAANGIAYWPIEELSAVFADQPGNEAAVDRFRAFLSDRDPEAFWRQVESNLKAGRVRMVFVADQIPKELRRVVEFLNEQMRPAEVLAIEVEQFVGAGGLRVLAPRLVGATERAAVVKAVQKEKPPITEEHWLNDLANTKGHDAAHNARRLLDWFREQGFVVGMTDSQDAVSARLERSDGKATWPFFIRRSTGQLETSLQYLKNNPAFESEEARLTLLASLKALPGQHIATAKSTGWPAIPLQALSAKEVWDGFAGIALRVKAEATRATSETRSTQ